MLRDALKNPDLLVEKAYINGEWMSAESGKSLAVTNPATGEVIAHIPDMGAKETSFAIERANAAWIEWRKTTAAERADLLEAWYGAMIDNLEDLALIMTYEQGKPLAESRGEIRYGAGFVHWFAEEARRCYGQTIPSPSSERRILTIKQPIGVCAAITPWNFPNAMITRKCAPALAAGCPIIVKPADLTPLSALALAVLAERVGIPAGVFNVITGQPAEIGQELTSNPVVRKISFTGSTNVGRLLMRQSAETIKRVSLELGGNAPFIVFDDADLEQAVAGAMASKFRNAGQTCVCANRILVQRGIYERFAARLVEEVNKLKIGSGLEADTTIGPMINAQAVAKVKHHIVDALEKGGKILAGAVPEENSPYVQPTVVGNASTEMVLAHDETFGPLAPLIPFDTEEEAISIANDTIYGLGAYFFTENISRSWRVMEALEFGMVGVNSGVISMEVAPFGGVKQSGIGREGSSLGLDEYMEVKTCHLGGL